MKNVLNAGIAPIDGLLAGSFIGVISALLIINVI